MTASVRLVDAPEEGRTTATLLAALAARLATLAAIDGATAVGSLVAGFGALGREVSKTAEGARLRRGLESGRPGVNGEALWSALSLEKWIARVPPSPLLDHLRNDLALLLAGDLAETIELLPIPGSPAGVSGSAADQGAAGDPTATFLDCTIGMWAFSRQLVRGVEALVARTLPANGAVVHPDARVDPPSGSLLR